MGQQSWTLLALFCLILHLNSAIKCPAFSLKASTKSIEPGGSFDLILNVLPAKHIKINSHTNLTLTLPKGVYTAGAIGPDLTQPLHQKLVVPQAGGEYTITVGTDLCLRSSKLIFFVGAEIVSSNGKIAPCKKSRRLMVSCLSC